MEPKPFYFIINSSKDGIAFIDIVQEVYSHTVNKIALEDSEGERGMLLFIYILYIIKNCFSLLSFPIVYNRLGQKS